MTTRQFSRVIAVLAVVTFGGACGGAAEEIVTQRASDEAPAPQQATDGAPAATGASVEAADLQRALLERPIAYEVSYLEVETLDQLDQLADRWIDGQLVGVSDLREQVIRSERLACPEEYRLPGEKDCLRETRIAETDLLVKTSDGEVAVTIPISTISTPLDASRAAAKEAHQRLAAAARGFRVVAALSGSHLAGPTALSVVAGDGSLTPLTLDGEQGATGGIAAATEVADLDVYMAAN